MMDNERNPMNTDQPEFENSFFGVDIPDEPIDPSESVQDFWNPNQQPPAENKSAVKVAFKSMTGKLGGKQIKLMAIGAAAIVVVVLLVILFGGLIKSPAAKVSVALGNTVKEFSSVVGLWNLDDAADVISGESNSMDVDVSINDLEDEDSVLIHSGVRFMMDTNMKKRNIDIQMVPYLGSADLMTVTVAADDEMIYFHSPELMPNPIGVNTETMMEDLEHLGADVGDAEDISFNLFDTIEIIREITAISDDNKKLLLAAGEDLIASFSAEKIKKQTIRVNGTSTECNVYEVIIPQDALEMFVEVLEEISDSVDYEESVEAVLDSMNLPRSVTREIMGEMSVEQPDFDEVYDLLDELGDVELKVYIKNNRIAAVRFDDEVYDNDWKAELYIGGGDRYVDNISFKLKNNYGELVVKSSGDHGAKDGLFTNKTTIEVDGDKYTLQVKYDPEADRDNLSVTWKDDIEAIKIKGTYQAGKNDFLLDLDEVVYEYRDEEEFDISVNVHMFKHTKRVEILDAVMLAEMTEDDLENMVEQIESMAASWAMELIQKNPELMYMF